MSPRIFWEPAIYEHKAALIGKSVMEVATSATLLTQALVAEYETYRADYMTVGLDIYNLEPEVCGAKVRELGREGCPDLEGPLWDMASLPLNLIVPDLINRGRMTMMLEAGRNAVHRLGQHTKIRLAASGPVSIASKLVGMEDLIMGLALGDDNATRLLTFTTALCAAWCAQIRQAHLEAVIFDSMASPPLLSPDLYHTLICPLHQKLMTQLQASGQTQRPLIMGGETALIAHDLATTGATMLVCDFPVDVAAYAQALANHNLIIRRNVSPQVILGTDAQITQAAATLRADLTYFAHPVAGTGVLPYPTNPENFWKLRRGLETTAT